MSKITSDLLKTEILEILLWKRAFLFWTTEFNNWYWLADVLAISKTMFVWEFETKISKADLKSELNSINLIIKNEEVNKRQWYYNKYIKHYSYIKCFEGLEWSYLYQKVIIPNYFCFFIPIELKEYALKELEDTPYWLYIIDNKEKIERKRIKCLIKPKKIHKKKIEEDKIFEFTKRLSSENLSLRKKYKNI